MSRQPCAPEKTLVDDALVSLLKRKNSACSVDGSLNRMGKLRVMVNGDALGGVKTQGLGATGSSGDSFSVFLGRP